jgi:hypothetical protein
MLRRGRRQKSRENGINIWRSLQMKMKCVTRRATKGCGTHILNCIRLMEKKDWNMLKEKIQEQWENVQYRGESSRKHYIVCRQIAKRSAGQAKDLEKKFKWKIS